MERATQERLVGATLLIVAGVILIPWLLDGSMTGSGVTEQELVLPGSNDNGNETRRITLDVPRQEAQGAAGSVREIDTRSVRAADQEAAPITLPAPAAQTRETSTSVAPARFARPMQDSAATPAASAAGTLNAPVTVNQPGTAQPKPKPTVASATSASPSSSGAGEQTGSNAGMAAAPSSPPQPVPARVTESSASNTAPATAADQAWAVQVGSFASQENAERLAERLRGKSYKAFVMRNVIEGRVRFRVRVGPVSQRSEAELLATALREDRQPARVLSHP